MDLSCTIGDTIYGPVEDAYQGAAVVHNLMLSAGIPEPAASYATYQVYHETGAFKSPLYKLHNNGSGIKFAKQHGATKGTNGYAWFPGGLKDWAASMAHELRKGSNPAGAKTLEDYSARLKANHYYEDDPHNYTEGLKRARLVLKVIPAADRAGTSATHPDTVQDPQDKDIPGTVPEDSKKFDLQKEWNNASTFAKAAIIIGGGLVVYKIVS